jgi:hypothetical protein
MRLDVWLATIRPAVLEYSRLWDRGLQLSRFDGATIALVSYGSEENTGVMLTLYSVETELIPAQLDLS